MHYNHKLLAVLFRISVPGLDASKKLVSVHEAINTLTTIEVFSSDAEANSAMAGIYTAMINGTAGTFNSAYLGYSEGLQTLMGSMSSDEFVYANSGNFVHVNTNHLIHTDGNTTLWQPAYSQIYGANAVIQGIAASTSGLLHDSVRKELTGEPTS